MDAAQQRIHAVVAAFARGEIVIVADDDDRENEGDLFVAASQCTPEKMAFIIRHTSGIVCAPLAQDEARRLHLDVDDAELAKRRAEWKAPEPAMKGGYQGLFVQHVMQADKGADFDFLVGCRGHEVPRESH